MTEFEPRSPTEALVGSDNANFRKGLVFGLTLAEVILLLLFMLLLALGALLKEAQDKAAGAEGAALRAAAAENRMKQLLTDYAPNASPPEVEKWVLELVNSGVGEEQAKQAVAQLAKATDALAVVDSAAIEAGVLKPKPVTQAPSTRNERAPAEEQRWTEAAVAADKGLGELRALRETNRVLEGKDGTSAAVELRKALLENERMKGTVAYSQRRLAELGRGTERPACWANSAGRPEYIFQVVLSGAGITLYDRKLPHRAEQQTTLPIGMIAFGRPLSMNEYRAQTRPLFNWGEEHECRFFVIAVDSTGVAQKEIFKQRLRVMEEHFYKYLSN